MNAATKERREHKTGDVGEGGTANPAAAGPMDANPGPAVVRAGRREAAEPHTKTRSHEAECRSRSEHRHPVHDHFCHDTALRLTNVTDGTYSASYTYLANSRLVSQISLKQNITGRMESNEGNHETTVRVLGSACCRGEAAIAARVDAILRCLVIRQAQLMTTTTTASVLRAEVTEPSGNSALRMRTALCAWSALVAAVLALTGCKTQEQPRVLRLALSPDGSTWRLTVNGVNRGRVLSSSSLTNEFTRLRPRWGDAILLDCPPSPPPSVGEATYEWLFQCWQSRRVAVNDLHAFAGVDIFSVRAYHWSAPFDNPYDLTSASFFREGKLLGRGTNGFDEVLRQLVRDHPKQVFIVGSKYDVDRTFGPDASPFEKQRDRLDDVLRAAGIDFIEVDPLP